MDQLIEFLRMKAEGEALSIVNMKGGAAIELIDLEIQKVLDNIDDPNTGTDTRKVKFEIHFKPNEDRSAVAFAFKPKSDLAGPEPMQGAAMLTTGKNGKPAAEEINRQREIPFNNVTRIGDKE